MGKLVLVGLAWLVLMQLGFVGKANPGGHTIAPTEEEMRNQVHQVATSLLSQDCTVRTRVIYEEFPNLDGATKAFLRKEITALTGEARSKLESLLQVTEYEEQVGQEFERLVKAHISPALRENDKKRSRLLTNAKTTLLSIANSPREPFFKREAAIEAIEFFVDQYDDPEGEMRRQGLPLGEWKKDLTTLLSANDSHLRSVVAGLIGMSPTFSDVPWDKTVPILLKSLRDDDTLIRLIAQNALQKLTKQDFCIDPTDPIGKRESGIHKWETWWVLAKGK